MLSHGLRKLSLCGGWVGAGRSSKHRRDGYVWHVTAEGAKLLGENGPDLEAWIREGLARVVKLGSQRTIYHVRLPTGDVFAKRCRVNGVRTWFRELLRPAKARLEFENALLLRDRGLPVVEPLAWACEARMGPGESIFITRCEAGAGPLQQLLDDGFPGVKREELPQRRRETAQELGRLLARLHDAGVAHPDPHPGNLLAAERAGRAPAVTLIDLHAIRFGPPLSWAEGLDNLVLFNRWFQLRASRSDRFRFWQAYVANRTTLHSASPKTVARMASGPLKQ